MNPHKLKELESMKKKLEAKHEVLQKEYHEAVGRYNQSSKRLKELANQIFHLKNSKLTVSEHALLRFAERAMGFDCKKATEQILTPAFKNLAEALEGNGDIPITPNLKGRVRNNVVVTIVEV